MTAPTYPFADLAAELGNPTPTVGAERIGVTVRTWHRLIDSDLDELRAERYAVAAGLIPFEVWPRMIDDQIAAASIECAASDCDTQFVPNRRGQKFCTRTCQHRTNARAKYRRRYQDDPEFRARETARKAAYAAETREYTRRWKRDYDRRKRAERQQVAA